MRGIVHRFLPSFLRGIVLVVLWAVFPDVCPAQTYRTAVPDGDGNVFCEAEYDASSRLLRTFHYIYDREGRRAAAVVYSYGDSSFVETRTLEQYDSHGRLLKRYQYTADEMLIFKETYSYNRRGDLRKRVQISYETAQPSRTVETRRYGYDASGVLISARYYLDGTLYYTYQTP